MPRSPLKSLAIFAVVGPFIFAASARCDTVIDSFDLDSNTLTTTGPPSSQTQPITIAGNPATRTLSASSNGAMTQTVVNAGEFDFASIPGGGVGSTEYSDFSLNASTTPYLRLSIGAALGAGMAEIGLTSSSAPGVLALLAPIPAGISSPTDLHFDLRTFAGYQPGSLTSVVSLAIAFTSATSSDYFLKVQAISLVTEDEFGASLPEPSLLALAMPTALLAFSRRRLRTALRP
jgi:hypothetical protein